MSCATVKLCIYRKCYQILYFRKVDLPEMSKTILNSICSMSSKYLYIISNDCKGNEYINMYRSYYITLTSAVLDIAY